MIQSNGKTVLVTGGAGYIGSHCIVSLQNAGYKVIALDNFANSVSNNDNQPMAIKRVEKITGQPVIFYQCDLLDIESVEEIFEMHRIDSVIHLAALKAVGESMLMPLLYYKNNIIGVINLLDVMKKYSVHNMVFSSSCTVYGEPKVLPITEDKPIGNNITNVYGRTKFFIEEILSDVSRSDDSWNIIALRYFNPVGAHESGLMGEDPTKQFTNIMPFISQVAMGNKAALTIFGDDYDTPDGTGIRDYIHVMDLAAGHVAALEKLEKEHLKLKAYNLGTGKGVSVLELVRAFEQTNNVQVPYEIEKRREGDISMMYADPSLAHKELNWQATRSLKDMCSDFWRWQKMNPHGYKTVATNGHNHN